MHAQTLRVPNLEAEEFPSLLLKLDEEAAKVVQTLREEGDRNKGAFDLVLFQLDERRRKRSLNLPDASEINLRVVAPSGEFRQPQIEIRVLDQGAFGSIWF